MSGNPVATDRLDSWKEIAGWLGRTVRTAIRWEKERGLPIHRVPGGERNAVFAYRHELEAWLQSGPISELIIDEAEAAAAFHVPDEAAAPTDLTATPMAPLAGGLQVRITRAGILALVAAMLGLVLVLALLRLAFPPDIHDGGETLIADVPNPIIGLVAGQGRLYFGAVRGGRTVLVTLPEAGGPEREIPTPFLQAEPVALSGDGKEVFVLAQAGQELERPLWKVPVGGGNPARVGQFLCHAAAWSPDGRALAYAFGNSIYLTTDNGTSVQLLHSFGDVPSLLQWSLDSRTLFVLLSNQAEDGALWRLSLDPTSQTVESMARLTRDRRHYDTISPPLDDRGDLFVAESGQDSKLWLVRSSRLSPLFAPEVQIFAHEIDWDGGIPLDPASRQLYFVRNTIGEWELSRFSPASGDNRPFLPGMSPHDVDFSRDSRRIAFVRSNPDSLWIARPDGTEARQINTAGILGLELPRWSPDGQELAFMGERADSLWRIYVVPASGGTPREASRGTDNQGAPSWSADGRTLVYGRVRCQEVHECAIAKIGLATGEEQVLPGSEGLSTARWSPDGRYIAALRTDSHQVYLEDTRTGAWRKLANGVTGNDLAWAPDSRSVYASEPDGQKPSILQIRLDGRVHTAIDLSSYSHLSGAVDTWFNVAPDGSILFARQVRGSEILALNYTGQ